MQSESSTGIEVRATHNPMAFLLAFCTPMVVIDGTPHPAGWNRPYFLPVAPGTHIVKIFFRYLWMPECGANSITLNVNEGGVRKVKFSMPSFIYAQGQITAV